MDDAHQVCVLQELRKVDGLDLDSEPSPIISLQVFTLQSHHDSWNPATCGPCVCINSKVHLKSKVKPEHRGASGMGILD